jgi:hypothetical protein
MNVLYSKNYYVKNMNHGIPRKSISLSQSIDTVVFHVKEFHSDDWNRILPSHSLKGWFLARLIFEPEVLSETSVHVQTTRRHILDLNIHTYRCENLKSYIL